MGREERQYRVRAAGTAPHAGQDGAAKTSTRPSRRSANSFREWTSSARRWRPRRKTSSTKSRTRWTACRTQIDAADAYNLDRTVELAMDAMRLPPPDAARRTPFRRRTPPRLPLQDAPSKSRPVAARRADEPLGRRVRRVARTVPVELQRGRRRGDARPLLPRQRRPVDSRTRPRPGLPVQGELHELDGAEDTNG